MESVSFDEASVENYVSTESMIADRGGITEPSALPKSGSVRRYGPGDILISNIRPYFKKIWRATRTGTCSNDVLVLRSNGSCNPAYLYYVLSSDDFFNYMTATSKGTKMPRGDKEAIMDYEIDLPSIEQQEQFTSTMSKIDDLIWTNSKINDYLSNLSQIVFHEWLFKRKMSNCISLIEKPRYQIISELCSTITDGSHYSPALDNGSHAILSVKDMKTNGFDRRRCKFISDDSFEKLRKDGCVPEINDILVAKDGSYLKEVFIVNEPMNDAILSSIAIFRPDKSKIQPLLLLHYFREPEVVSYVKENCVSGSAIPRIVLKSFKQIRFLVPPIEEQKQITPILESIHKQILNNEKTNEILVLLRENLLLKIINVD